MRPSFATLLHRLRSGYSVAVAQDEIYFDRFARLIWVADDGCGGVYVHEAPLRVAMGILREASGTKVALPCWCAPCR